MTDDWDDEYEGDEFEDVNFDDESYGWYECPLCHAEVYDDANLCPTCDEYMSPKLVTRAESKPMWYIFLGMSGILAVVIALSGLIRMLG